MYIHRIKWIFHAIKLISLFLRDPKKIISFTFIVLFLYFTEGNDCFSLTSDSIIS